MELGEVFKTISKSDATKTDFHAVKIICTEIVFGRESEDNCRSDISEKVRRKYDPEKGGESTLEW